MKKICQKILLVVWILFISTPHPIFAQSNTATPTKTGTFGVLIQAFQDYQNLHEQIKTTQISLEFEQNLEFPSLKEIDRIDQTLTEKQAELAQLQDKQSNMLANSDQTSEAVKSEVAFLDLSVIKKQTEIAELEIEKLKYRQTYDDRKQKQELNISTLTQELDTLNEQLIKQRTLIRKQSQNFLIYAGIAICALLFFLSLRLISGRLIRRFSNKISPARLETLVQINRVVFNIIFAVIVIGVAFAQFTNLLSVLAILGTGLAFAIRDTISSFLAWFVIGTDRGYKVGDIIEIDPVKGKVIEITPLLTALADRSPGWNTGKIITMPNKVIFEQKIFNASRCFKLTAAEVSFCLTTNSNISKAKTILQDIIDQHNTYSKDKTLPKKDRIIKEGLFGDSDFNTLITVESDTRGLWIKGLFLVRREVSDEAKQNVQEAFILYVQSSTDIFFQLTT